MNKKDNTPPPAFDYGSAFAVHEEIAAKTENPRGPAPVPVGNGPSWQAVMGIVVAMVVFLGLLAPVGLFFYYRYLQRFYATPEAQKELQALMFKAIGIGLAVMAALWVVILAK